MLLAGAAKGEKARHKCRTCTPTSVLSSHLQPSKPVGGHMKSNLQDNSQARKKITHMLVVLWWLRQKEDYTPQFKFEIDAMGKDNNAANETAREVFMLWFADLSTEARSPHVWRSHAWKGFSRGNKGFNKHPGVTIQFGGKTRRLARGSEHAMYRALAV
ncbi:uncharacterized protein MCYG_05187 [Microsporum canis CBS 113480]|uniref:Uncharacterized protein n=1 Tax=Arthroderma otae (strain ATCC MYA-4605 / CBS 113480) TaxID=554155 RepID=C5FR65_ARTOC|nr:uncharacterized protein MCYG_05187 [Microsporum canis CBS 113480]EEQ32368.1 predicted protein [Microsporum canis CBS 113480]